MGCSTLSKEPLRHRRSGDLEIGSSGDLEAEPKKQRPQSSDDPITRWPNPSRAISRGSHAVQSHVHGALPTVIGGVIEEEANHPALRERPVFQELHSQVEVNVGQVGSATM